MYGGVHSSESLGNHCILSLLKDRRHRRKVRHYYKEKQHKFQTPQSFYLYDTFLIVLFTLDYFSCDQDKNWRHTFNYFHS